MARANRMLLKTKNMKELKQREYWFDQLKTQLIDSYAATTNQMTQVAIIQNKLRINMNHNRLTFAQFTIKIESGQAKEIIAQYDMIVSLKLPKQIWTKIKRYQKQNQHRQTLFTMDQWPQRIFFKKGQQSETSTWNKEEEINHKITAIKISNTPEETNKSVNFAAKKVMKWKFSIYTTVNTSTI